VACLQAVLRVFIGGVVEMRSCSLMGLACLCLISSGCYSQEQEGMLIELNRQLAWRGVAVGGRQVFDRVCDNMIRLVHRYSDESLSITDRSALESVLGDQERAVLDGLKEIVKGSKKPGAISMMVRLATVTERDQQTEIGVEYVDGNGRGAIFFYTIGRDGEGKLASIAAIPPPPSPK
jgi:hypothetical protein